MNSQEVAGYTNGATFDIAHHITNDQALLEYWTELAADIYDHEYKDMSQFPDVWDREQCARFELADRLADSFDTQAEDADLDAPLSSLVLYALGAVNWTEIAEVLLDKIKEGAS